MDNSLFNISNPKSERPARSKRPVTAIIICFLVSVFLWILIMLSKNYNAHIRFHIVYEDIPEGKVITNPLPKQIEFFINAGGFDVLSYRLKARGDQISINISDNIQDRTRIADNVYRIPTKTLLPEFDEQMKRDVDIISISPEYIDVNLKAQ